MSKEELSLGKTCSGFRIHYHFFGASSVLVMVLEVNILHHRHIVVLFQIYKI